MKMLFKQRAFSWFDSYDIFDEYENVLFRVEGRLSWGHKLEISDANGRFLGTVREKVFAWMPRFKLYVGDEYAGSLRRKFRLFGRKYILDFKGWQVSGDVLGWDYVIADASGSPVATVQKRVLSLTDTYMIEVFRPEAALYALMIVLSIDADNCNR